MAEDKPTAKNCKVCGHVLVSTAKQCHNCQASDPIKKDDPALWPWAVFFTVIVVLLLL